MSDKAWGQFWQESAAFRGYWEIGIILVSMVILIAIGVVAFNALERKVRIKGTLGQH